MRRIPTHTPKTGTAGHKKLAKLLRDRLGEDVVEEFRVGPYSADCYIPAWKFVFEYDGPLHAMRRKKDKERDEYMLQHGILAVLRFTESDLAKPDELIARIIRVCEELDDSTVAEGDTST